ncbi:MAG: hypothetical protein UY64_C0050G0009 [Parcubacteria group bacterium GW2011_GWA1_51_12]|nr:MAG: hypothetical protein UY64_C0050G0009 [Parcubacteria group bacterium GW2011_GWA1_51_12]
MTNPVIIDSSGLISFISDTDSNHQLAVSISQSIKKEKNSVILPGEIFSEIVNVLGKKVSHNIALQTAHHILNSKDFAIVETNTEIREGALEIFRNQAQSVSFTDCLVMAFADHYHTKTIFGFDEVFRKNKYQRLGLDNAL